MGSDWTPFYNGYLCKIWQVKEKKNNEQHPCYNQALEETKKSNLDFN